MVKFIIVALLFIPAVVIAQQPVTFRSADSITYQCYLKGEWEKLISTGQQAIAQNIDYKRLRQRIGYAWFARGDYYAAQSQYEKALAFDECDPDIREYLYYCALKTGNQVNARFIAKDLTPDLKKILGIETFKPVESIDLEYNYKSNNSLTRSNPTYLRTGVNTQLGYRLQLYQSVSNYQQTIDSALTKQPEYYALLSYSFPSKISIDVAYHYLNTRVGNYKIPGNMIFAGISKGINRLNLGINGSVLNNSTGNTTQIGLQAKVTLPGKSGIYFQSSLCGINEPDGSGTILAQSAGLRVTKNLWAEGNITLGYLKNYNDFRALYVYNSVDPTTFRTGLSLFWYLGKPISLFGNYTFDQKQITSNLNIYNQQSFSGGIIWKL